MSLRTRLVVALISLIAVLTFQANAQQPSPAPGATIHGMVTDPDDALVPGATVTLTPATGKPQIVTSGSDGTYTARGVSAGTYVMTVTAPGFAAFVKEGIKVAAGVNLTLDPRLAIAEETQQMTVTAQSAQLSVDPDSNASATVITGAALEALSDDPDELQTELTALAGPSMGPNGGQIYIDGFTGGQLPPKASIMAIRINQNPFSAQYDQLGFGRIEILTRPGADKFHGGAGLQFGDKVLNTSTPFLGAANSQPDYYTIFSTANLTGPIRQGMSFNVAGSYRDIKNNSIVNPSGFYASSATSTTLCAPGDLTCSSQAFPTTARALSNPQTRWDISPRVDVALGQKNTLTTRFSTTHSSSSIVPSVASQLLTTGSNSNSSEITLQMSDTQLLGNKVVNESRFEYQHTASNSTPLSTSPFISVQGILSAGGTSAGTNSTPGDHIEAQNYTSVQMAKNFIRFGGRLRTSGESPYSNGGTNGSFSYSYLLDPCVDPTITNKPANCVAGLPSTAKACAATNYTGGTAAEPSSYQCNVVSQFSLTKVVNSTIQARETVVGFYAEDDWKALSNLTISYGLRLEAQNVIDSERDLAPRTSIAYGIPTKSGKTTTVVRAGFGVFFNRFQLGSIASQITNNGQNTQDLVYSSPGTNCQPLFNGTAFTGYSPTCTTASATPAKTTIQLNDPGLRSPYVMQSALTLEQQIGKYGSVTVSYLNARGEHQFLQRYLPNGSSIDAVNQSGGVFRQNQLTTNVNIRTPKGMTIFGFYSANWADSNISNITNPYNSSTDYGRAAFAVKSRVVLGGNVPLPFKFTASPLLFAQSGSPYNVTAGVQDPVTLQYNDRPAFAAGATSANCYSASSFGGATGTTGEVPVNYCTGPASASVNLRLARTFGFGPKSDAAIAAAARAQGQGGPGGPGGFGGGPGGPGGGGGGGGRPGGGGGPGGGGPGGGGPGGGGGGSSDRRYTVTVGAQASNLFNEVPYGPEVSSLTSPLFGKSTSLQAGPGASANAVRRIMLQLNFNF